ncbi:hypothetical protein HLB23_40570 [Nocardia uniformis]|uniref:Uncharacterized protein n=1 Tax=Nocardia uniformis TaxID=53432 RepID=A0A849CBZ1_9NOCA|nr:hypothetical protein [Nocardia uniformis]NNH76072.1 hypothetical protein [Nocardia uniformis]
MSFARRVSHTRHHVSINRTLLLAAIVAVALTVHFGLGGAVLSGGWTGPTIGIIVAVLVGKVALIAVGHRRIRLRRVAEHETSDE